MSQDTRSAWHGDTPRTFGGQVANASLNAAASLSIIGLIIACFAFPMAAVVMIPLMAYVAVDLTFRRQAILDRGW